MPPSQPSPPRLPTPQDFPPSLTLTITPPPSSQPALNILILLHGLGDTHLPFSNLAAQLNLPYTCILTIRGPTPVPALITGSDAPSFHWGDDLLFDEGTGEIDMDAGFRTSGVVLGEVVVGRCLVGKCGYRKRDVFFWGFGQGGMAALGVVAADPLEEFGGVISVGGRLPASSTTSASASGAGGGGGSSAEGKARTPVLVLGGSRSKQVTRSAVQGLKERFVEVEYVKWAKYEDGMPASREEMLPIMKFFARRLRSRAGVPEGAVEIG